MDFDPYAEEDVAKERAQRQRQSKFKNQPPVPAAGTAPVSGQSITIKPAISSRQIMAIMRQQYQQPVLSLYLNLTPDRLLQSKEVILALFHSLRHTEEEQRADYITSLSHEGRQSLAHDLERAADFLASQFDPSGSRSLVLFLSGSQLNAAFQLAIPGQDYLAIGPTPYILSLETMLNAESRVILLRLVHDDAQPYLYHLGRLRQLAPIKQPETLIASGTAHVNRVQRRNEGLVDKHIKNAADHAQQLMGRFHADWLVLMGDERMLLQLQQHLSDKDRVICCLPDIPNQSIDAKAEAVRGALLNQEAKAEQHIIAQLANQGGHNGLIQGVDEVIPAQNRFLIRSLFVGQDFKRPGFMCPTDTYVSLEQSECPVCHQPLVLVDNVADSLLGWSKLFHVQAKVFTQLRQALQPYGGIAATMYDL